MHGPLPLIEVFTAAGYSTYGPNDADRDYWDSLEINPSHWLNYSSPDGVTVFEPESYDLPPYRQIRVVVDPPAFLEQKDIRGYHSEQAAVSHVLADRLASLGIAVAVEEVLKRIRRDATNVRNELAPEMAGIPRGLWKRLMWFPRTSKYGAILNHRSFDLGRLLADAVWERLSSGGRYLSDGGLQRQLRPEDPPERFGDHCAWYLSRLATETNQQLEQLRAHHAAQLTFALQNVTFALTLVGIVLSIVGLVLAVPEHIRAALFDKLFAP